MLRSLPMPTAPGARSAPDRPHGVPVGSSPQSRSRLAVGGADGHRHAAGRDRSARGPADDRCSRHRAHRRRPARYGLHRSVAHRAAQRRGVVPGGGRQHRLRRRGVHPGPPGQRRRREPGGRSHQSPVLQRDHGCADQLRPRPQRPGEEPGRLPRRHDRVRGRSVHQGGQQHALPGGHLRRDRRLAGAQVVRPDHQRHRVRHRREQHPDLHRRQLHQRQQHHPQRRGGLHRRAQLPADRLASPPSRRVATPGNW